MSAHTHLDMNQIIQDEIRSRRQNSLPEQQPPEPNTHISMEGAHLNAEYGPQQVEAILHYVIDYPLAKAMADAEDDADAVQHLRRLKRQSPKYT